MSNLLIRVVDKYKSKLNEPSEGEEEAGGIINLSKSLNWGRRWLDCLKSYWSFVVFKKKVWEIGVWEGGKMAADDDLPPPIRLMNFVSEEQVPVPVPSFFL